MKHMEMPSPGSEFVPAGVVHVVDVLAEARLEEFQPGRLREIIRQQLERVGIE